MQRSDLKEIFCIAKEAPTLYIGLISFSISINYEKNCLLIKGFFQLGVKRAGAEHPYLCKPLVLTNKLHVTMQVLKVVLGENETCLPKM